MEGNDGGRRGRPPWHELWRTGDDGSIEECKSQLPRFTTAKNSLTRCTLNHVDRDEDELAQSWHEMWYELTKCASKRCNDSRDTCLARYKTLACQQADVSVLFSQGEHAMDLNTPASPVEIKLTREMESYLNDKLSDTPSMVAQLAFSFLCREVRERRIEGPPPDFAKVQNYVKTWRSKHKPDGMSLVLEICKMNIYDLEVAAQDSASLIIFCDSRRDNGDLKPVLGTGSSANPFRIGLTSMQLMQSYVDVQSDPNLSTMLHLDSTHSVVKQKYPVFVLGISDQSGGFLPIVYCCVSQRREYDITWCLQFLKRVIYREFGVPFSPDFVMMDADHAQYNACVAELPHSTVPMCWFHVMQNVLKHVHDAKLDSVSRQLIFRNFYDLHFTTNEQQYLRKRDFVIAFWRGAGAICSRFRIVSNHIIKTWLLGARFWRWQAYHTLSGYASTNNPLETYHFKLKLVNNSKPATPAELVNRLDLSRIAYESSMTTFSAESAVSKRMRAAYSRANTNKALDASLVHRAQNPVLVRVFTGAWLQLSGRRRGKHWAEFRCC